MPWVHSFVVKCVFMCDLPSSGSRLALLIAKILGLPEDSAFLAHSAFANHIDFVVDGKFFLNVDESAFVSDIQVGDGGNIIGTEREVSIGVLSGQGFVNVGTVGAADGAGPVGPLLESAQAVLPAKEPAE